MPTNESTEIDQRPIRSPLLMSISNTALIVIDVQQRLMPAILSGKRLAWNIKRLIDAAKLLDVGIFATEQYPQGLGHTIPQLASEFENVFEKRVFSCRECVELTCSLQQNEIENVILVGIESHVCVQQTALDMLSSGFNVFVPVDAVGSRHAIDHETAITRMLMSGVTGTTTEAAIFELCETSKHPQFKTISKLVQQTFNESENSNV